MEGQQVQVGEDGTLLIPASLCRELGLGAGDTVVMSVHEKELRIRSSSAAMAQARALVRQHVPCGVSLVDELIAERREEARREETGVDVPVSNR